MKILITSVRAGSGHVRAAEALGGAIARVAPQVECRHVDATDWMMPSFRRVYLDGYHLAAEKLPSLWGRIYYFWDERDPTTGLTPWLCRAQRSFAAPFYEYVERFQPDVILTTHFLIPQLLSCPPANFNWNGSVESVITDYRLHPFWVSKVISRYYVAHKGLTRELMALGVSQRQVLDSGIPVDSAFAESVDPSKVRTQLGLDPLRPVILVLSGGLGMNRIEETVQQLFQLAGRPQIVTVAGRNERLAKRLARLQAPPSIRHVSLGYVQNMHDWLSASHVVVTKPGGLTVTECLAKRKPMVLVSPIPGQEERNAEFFAANDAALYAHTPDEIPALVGKILTDPSLRDGLRQHMSGLARPFAAYVIANRLIDKFAVAA